ncbi:DUF6632 domain-containing protein [Dyella caseinilytica]|uniref:Uncharacterized protein n=1 Tax=Dyella caseinilytica TaxID=1849581 RepID=A0ABX7GS88_9GAMM|nr:DUF6632 domain-containing protein [Dyella caseinilytica]QRN52130.1 hypothetical protein ISN74_11530 [Dyella caseinilytica]GGA13590.1 hypothetical protein GCM10011408_38820 [Dyella caseinilytica]
MDNATRLRYLQFALRAIGLVFIFGVYPLTVVWPSGWSWYVGQSHYLQMIIGIYATLGIFLFLAAKDPTRHISLISFAIWSSVVHGAIMTVQSFSAPENMGHLYGDVLALFVVAAVLAFLCPAAARLSFDGSAA